MSPPLRKSASKIARQRIWERGSHATAQRKKERRKEGDTNDLHKKGTGKLRCLDSRSAILCHGRFSSIGCSYASCWLPEILMNDDVPMSALRWILLHLFLCATSPFRSCLNSADSHFTTRCTIRAVSRLLESLAISFRKENLTQPCTQSSLLGWLDSIFDFGVFFRVSKQDIDRAIARRGMHNYSRRGYVKLPQRFKSSKEQYRQYQCDSYLSSIHNNLWNDHYPILSDTKIRVFIDLNIFDKEQDDTMRHLTKL